MIRQILLLGLVAATCPFQLIAADKQDKQAAQDLLAAAVKQTSLLEDSSKPFLMDVAFVAQFDGARQGHLQLRWESKDRWWSKVTVGPFEQVVSLNGDKSYTLRNVDFTLLQVRDLMNLLHVERGLKNLTAKKDKQSVENGVKVDCIEVERPGSGSKHDEVCIDAGTSAIVKTTLKGDPEGIETHQYSDFVEFGGRTYPRRLQLDKNGSTVITANVMELKEDPLDPKLLEPPEGATVRRACADPTPPKSVNMPDIFFDGGPPPSGGTTTLQLTVLTSGKVGAVHVIQSGGPDLDQAFIRAVKGARFKPAMCGTEPVELETTMTVVSHSLHY
jgi:TonB family protein